MSGQGGLQLLPETRKRIDVSQPGENRYIIIGGVMIVAILAAFFALNGYAQSQEDTLAEINNSLLALEQGRDKNIEADVIAIKTQTGLLSRLLGEHIFVTKAMVHIGNVIQTQVQAHSVKISTTGGTVVINAVAPNYATVAHQMVALTSDDGITDIVLSGLKNNPGTGVEFEINLKLVPDKFFK